MAANQNVAVSIHFQQVAMESIEPKATNWKLRVVVETKDLARVTELHQPLLEQIES